MARSTSIAVVAVECVVFALFACRTSPIAPATARPSDLTGTWKGSLADPQGTAALTWTLTQTGQGVSGAAITQPSDPNDGTCASCHKNKTGVMSGSIAGSILTLTMSFPGGTPGEPTPICAVTLTGTSSSISDDTIMASYSGMDTCEGPLGDGRIVLTRR